MSRANHQDASGAEDVTAVLMCAGRSSRSMTARALQVPKCLIPIGGDAFLGSLIHWLRKAGVSNFVLVTHTHADQISHFLSTRSDLPHNVSVVELAELRDTNWTALHGLRQVQTSKALVLTTDTVWKIDLNRLVRDQRPVDVLVPVISSSSGSLPRGNVAVGQRRNIVRFSDAGHVSGTRKMLAVGLYLINNLGTVMKFLKRPGELDSTGIDPVALWVGAFMGVERYLDFGEDESLFRLRQSLSLWPDFWPDQTPGGKLSPMAMHRKSDHQIEAP